MLLSSESVQLSQPLREALRRDLAAAVAGDVDFGSTARAMYGADASNYRRIPLGVVFPRTADDVAATLRLCRDAGVPVTMRGGGTSIAGNSIGPGVVIDTSRHLNRLLDIDPDRRTARVEPGLVLTSLTRATAAHGLTFGPDPSTASRCTLGGMIGNNACGTHSVAWGTTADNVESLDLICADGTPLTVGSYTAREWQDKLALAGREGELFRALDELEGRHRQTWRTELSDYSRRVSGYGVERLLAERGRSVAKALVGTEGTCAIVVGATLRLVPLPKVRVLLILGYPDDIAAADNVPAILTQAPLAVEGWDAELLAVAGGSGAAPDLPDGTAWLFVELGADDADEAAARAQALLDATGAGRTGGPSARIVTSPAEQAALWRLRADGAGLATRDTTGGEAWPGWEDAAVPPERLGSYLREFRALLRKHDLRGVSYGHFGEGCIHVRINFDMVSEPGVKVFRSFLEDAADTVAAHGGSLSGEHGDGMARSELLARMYAPEVIGSFADFKRVWDPQGALNPGIIVDPAPLDGNLRYTRRADLALPVLHYPEDQGDLGRAVRRCVGVGKCRSDVGAVMCPSWLVTKDEKHSTRGRARILQEIVNGEFVTDGWRSKEALEALDLCLSCKGCSSDCPTGVDMATYKAEFLHQHYRGRMRPLSHLSMGWLPVAARLATRVPSAVNALTRSPLQGLIKRLGGIDANRRIPAFAARSFVSSYRRRGRPDRPRTGQQVLLWPDTFNNYLTPEVLTAGDSVLAKAGLAPRLPDGGVCCGLTWFSTGQLGTARRVLERTARALAPAQRAGLPIVVLEPSCATMLRSESRSVLGETPFTAYLREHVVTLAEALERYAPDWQPPTVARPAVGQVHCHQSSVLGFDADRRLMARAGLDPAGMQRSCCGLAGNFGFEDGHFDVSRAAAERLLLPAVEGAAPDAVVMADGYSCRTQLQQLAGRRAAHLAEVLDGRLNDDR
ncbi:FAD-binding oxidoreductase [Planosporangium thailandense]|uniref:FAD-binding oxidoreductase n=1 Tax=Planosporangium thailandense TaxID=765197 RepID=A0ABX0Y6H7_9ACTN|nr:FAD-binding and (Fe-S)-binding domain-containing protein [Planosporangium thailandense]NJC73933.1 FAD-binding oxidoreductase [Planosporangium thailandense]